MACRLSSINNDDWYSDLNRSSGIADPFYLNDI